MDQTGGWGGDIKGVDKYPENKDKNTRRKKKKKARQKKTIATLYNGIKRFTVFIFVCEYVYVCVFAWMYKPVMEYS